MSVWYVDGYFVIRVAESGVSAAEGNEVEVFDLTRVPMGASFSAHVAQTVTWALVALTRTNRHHAGSAGTKTAIDKSTAKKEESSVCTVKKQETTSCSSDSDFHY